MLSQNEPTCRPAHAGWQASRRSSWTYRSGAGGAAVKGRRGRIAGVAALLLTPMLLGCAIIDSYSGRAVDYNREAEQAQEQVLLLNIVRASLRLPMQFTSLQSITGSANVNGSVSAGGIGSHQKP